jgi:hypothetical protein
MWHIAIKYKSNMEDIVSPFMLDTLITFDQIKQFYRPSEERWVTLGVDPIRKAEVTHRVPERRRPICNDIICPGPSSGSH